MLSNVKPRVQLEESNHNGFYWGCSARMRETVQGIENNWTERMSHKMFLTAVSTSQYLNLHIGVMSKEFNGSWSEAKIVRSIAEVNAKELIGN